MLDKGIDTPEGKSLAEYTLDYMLNRLSDYQEMDNGKLLWNLEATPAEGAGTRFARGDRKDFKGIITGAGTNMEFYTNSTQLPDHFTDNIYEVFDHQESLQTKYTSGTVQHVYLNEPVYNWRVVESLVKKLFTNYRIPYISISANITICPVCGRLKKTTEYCKGNHTREQVDELIAKGVISENDLIEY
jgi:ribonucleoside-triphosphate reductase